MLRFSLDVFILKQNVSFGTNVPLYKKKFKFSPDDSKLKQKLPDLVHMFVHDNIHVHV
jgi:hypothetical protein